MSPPECDQHLMQDGAGGNTNQSASSYSSQSVAFQDPLRESLETYLHALLLHYLSGNFLKAIKQGNGEKDVLLEC